MPDHATTRHLIHLVRDLALDAFIVARCRYHVLHWELLGAGAHEVVDEEDQLGRRLAAQVRKLVACLGSLPPQFDRSTMFAAWRPLKKLFPRGDTHATGLSTSERIV